MRVAATGQTALILMSFFAPSIFQRVHHADDAQLAGAVIGLAEIAIEAGRGGGHDDAAEVLRFHDVPCSVNRQEGAAQVNGENQVDVLNGHFGE
jgi:hypothetical protein